MNQPWYFASVWTSDDCNLKCAGCFFHDANMFGKTFTPTYMTKDVADGFIDLCNKGFISGISFFGAEPMMNWPMMKRILVRTHETTMRKVEGDTVGSVYHVTTNGTHFTPENLEDLELHDTHINMSFDGLPSTQNKWRGRSYDQALEHIDLLLEYPSLTILKLMVDPTRLYDDIKHIKDLGFSSVFINHLDPYSQATYMGYSIDDWRRQYTRVVKELHDPQNFEVLDFKSWGSILTTCEKNTLIGCGYVFKGLGIAPDGKLYTCHQAPSLGEEFSIGDVWNGIDHEREAKIRNVKNAPSCTRCVYRMSKCYVQMYLRYKRFGVEAAPWHREWEIAKMELVAELKGIEMPGPYVCREDPFDNVLTNMTDMINDFFLPGSNKK